MRTFKRTWHIQAQPLPEAYAGRRPGGQAYKVEGGLTWCRGRTYATWPSSICCFKGRGHTNAQLMYRVSMQGWQPPGHTLTLDPQPQPVTHWPGHSGEQGPWPQRRARAPGTEKSKGPGHSGEQGPWPQWRARALATVESKGPGHRGEQGPWPQRRARALATVESKGPGHSGEQGPWPQRRARALVTAESEGPGHRGEQGPWSQRRARALATEESKGPGHRGERRAKALNPQSPANSPPTLHSCGDQKGGPEPWTLTRPPHDLPAQL